METLLDNLIENISSLRLSTTPLLMMVEGIPKIRGTCSFIKYKGHHFIITAEHVLTDFENNLYLLIKNESKSLLKPGGISYLDATNDIGIIFLDEPTVEKIAKAYEFLEISEDRTIVKESNSQFSFIGFPETRGRYNRYKDKMKIEHLIFTSEEADDETKRKYGILENNICIFYDKNRVYNVVEGKYKTGPILYGVSGCLLIQHLNDGFNIVGILTDWNEKNKNLLIGTKMNLINKILDYAISQSSK